MTDFENRMGAYPTRLSQRMWAVRALIHEVAAHDLAIGDIEESIKWGEPSFAAVRPKSGTPIRIGGDMAANTYSLFVHCGTSLVADFRTVHPDMFIYHGNREIRLDLGAPMPETTLTIFITSALRYYL